MRKGNKWEFVTKKNNKNIVIELDKEVNFKNDRNGKYILKHFFYGNSMGKTIYPTKNETKKRKKLLKKVILQKKEKALRNLKQKQKGRN